MNVPISLRYRFIKFEIEKRRIIFPSRSNIFKIMKGFKRSKILKGILIVIVLLGVVCSVREALHFHHPNRTIHKVSIVA